MGFAVKANGWDDRLTLITRMREIVRGAAAEAVGVYMVSQIGFSHEVQGRDEDDRHGVWPPRKVQSTGLIVFGKRGAVRKAIREALTDPTKKEFTIERAKKAPKGVVNTFSRKQVLGAKLAIEEEKKRKVFLKKEGITTARGRKERRRSLKKIILLSIEQQDFERAMEANKELDLIKQAITGASSFRRTANYLPRPVLLRTGNLKDSWTFRVEVLGGRVIIWIGTQVPYAKYHELGTAHIPQRRQVVISRQDKANIAELVSDIVKEKYKNG